MDPPVKPINRTTLIALIVLFMLPLVVGSTTYVSDSHVSSAQVGGTYYVDQDTGSGADFGAHLTNVLSGAVSANPGQPVRIGNAPGSYTFTTPLTIATNNVILDLTGTKLSVGAISASAFTITSRNVTVTGLIVDATNQTGLNSVFHVQNAQNVTFRDVIVYGGSNRSFWVDGSEATTLDHVLIQNSNTLAVHVQASDSTRIIESNIQNVPTGINIDTASTGTLLDAVTFAGVTTSVTDNGVSTFRVDMAGLTFSGGTRLYSPSNGVVQTDNTLTAGQKLGVDCTVPSGVTVCVSDGTTVAQSGLLGIPNNRAIKARNGGNTGDLTLITTDSSNNIIIGGGGVSTVSTTNNFGVGTNSPVIPLDVVGTGGFRNATAASILLAPGGCRFTPCGPTIEGTPSYGTPVYLNVYNANDLDFGTNSNIRMAINGSNAVVGINTATPSLPGSNVGLVIAGATSDSAVRLQNAQTNGRTMELLDTINAQNTGGLQIHAPSGNPGEWVQFDGKVGINTLAPNAWLHVKGADADGNIMTVSGSNVNLVTGFDSAGNGHAFLGTSGANDFAFNTSGTTHMTLDKNGALFLPAVVSVGTPLELGNGACMWGTSGAREINIAGCDSLGNSGLVLKGQSSTASPYINFQNSGSTTASIQWSNPSGALIADAPSFEFTTGNFGLGPGVPHGSTAFEQSNSVTSASGVGFGMYLHPTLTVGNNNEAVEGISIRPTFAMASKTGAAAYGLVIDGTGWTATNTVSSNAGFAAYFAAPTAFNTNYALYSASGTNYFGGNTGLGTTSGLTSLLNLASGTDAAHGIQWGTDTNLYRSAASTLKTDGALNVTGVAFLGTTQHKTSTTSSLSYVLSATDNLVVVNSGGSGTVTLPAANTVPGREYIVCAEGSGTKANLTPSGSDVLIASSGNLATYQLDSVNGAQLQCALLISEGVSGYITVRV